LQTPKQVAPFVIKRLRALQPNITLRLIVAKKATKGVYFARK